MTYEKFKTLCGRARDCDSLLGFMMEEGAAIPVSVPNDKIEFTLQFLYTYGQDPGITSLRKLIRQAEMSFSFFCRIFEIPRMTFESWSSGKSEAPAYVINILAYGLLIYLIEDFPRHMRG
jgi:hypothetical protein